MTDEPVVLQDAAASPTGEGSPAAEAVVPMHPPIAPPEPPPAPPEPPEPPPPPDEPPDPAAASAPTSNGGIGPVVEGHVEGT